MKRMCSQRALQAVAVAAAAGLLSACAAPPKPFDYTAFKASKPASLLVLPPLNETHDVNAVSGVLATATQPLAEAGYYVIPVGLMDETFKQNGLTVPQDIQAVAPKRLRDIFGADAAMYLKVTSYGSAYRVTMSETRVTVSAKLVDLRNGKQLWQGRATASSAESNNSNGGLAGALLSALVQQVLSNVTDASFNYAVVANQRLFSLGADGDILPGPRWPSETVRP